MAYKAKLNMSIYPKGVQAEKSIENFLEENVDLVEPGLVLIKRQYALHYVSKRLVGKIDLFCQGNDKTDVCIELKAEALDARNVGQMMAYYDILNTRATQHDRPKPRLYCIGAKVSGHYRHALNVLDGGRTINLTTMLYKLRPGVSLDDDIWPINIQDYDPRFKIRKD